MLWIWVIIIVFINIIYVALPLWLKIIVFLINLVIPDVIPVIDELVMGINLLVAIGRAMEVQEKHGSKIKAVVTVIIIGAVIFAILKFMGII